MRFCFFLLLTINSQSVINEHHHFRKYSDKDEQSKKKRLSIKVNKITCKLSVKIFMHHLALLLEKVADLFPLSIKSDGFLLLVFSNRVPTEDFPSRISAAYAIAKVLRLLVFEKTEMTMSILKYF